MNSPRNSTIPCDDLSFPHMHIGYGNLRLSPTSDSGWTPPPQHPHTHSTPPQLSPPRPDPPSVVVFVPRTTVSPPLHHPPLAVPASPLPCGGCAVCGMV